VKKGWQHAQGENGERSGRTPAFCRVQLVSRRGQ